MTGSVLGQQYPKASRFRVSFGATVIGTRAYLHCYQPVVYHDLLGQAVHGRAKSVQLHEPRAVNTHKSAPMVALYWLLKRLFTYWFMSEVLPTLHTMYKSTGICEQSAQSPSHVPTVAENNHLR